ncbi:hypothetical protein BHM03_00042180 [Ensete ventricosum]|nr:hypothetical protein BHM03_00042180 [Ensete ventricosum]
MGFITCTRSAREGSSTETSRPPTSSSLQISNLRYHPLPPAASKSTSDANPTPSRLRSQTSALRNGFRRSGLTAPSRRSKAHLGTYLSTLGFKLTHFDARNGGADGNRQMPGAGIFHARHRGREDRCVCVWCLPVRDHIREETSGWISQELAQLGKCHDGSLQMLVDPRLGDDYDMEQLKRLSFAASLCIRPTAALRPSMTEMLELMEGGEISQDRWKLLEEAEVEEEFWGFDDLDDEDDDDCNTPTTPSTTGSSQP